jgi:hypothetical protein
MTLFSLMPLIIDIIDIDIIDDIIDAIIHYYADIISLLITLLHY